MHSDIPPPAPKRGPAAKSDLTGPQVKQALDAMGVTIEQFCFMSGVNRSRFQRQINGSDPEPPPLFYEAWLFIFENHPEYRKGNAMLDLPFEKWGIELKG